MTNEIRVAIADTFWDRLFDIPKAQQRKVRAFVTKFRQSPTASGINYERLHYGQDDFRSVRIDQAYRCILLAPKKGNVYVLLWVDIHDDAYDWAKRTRVEVHPMSGVLQIFRVEEGVDDNVGDSAVAAAGNHLESRIDKDIPTPATRLPDPIFNYDAVRLLGLGVPEVMLERVADLRSESELDSIRTLLPTEAFEALALLACGMEWDEIWKEYGNEPAAPVDVEDIGAAIEREGSKRRFYVIDDDEELQNMLAAPLEKWRVYLHPSQRRLVERDWNGPVRILGGAGTGKTVVAMHRAAWLAKHRLPSEDNSARILFLTYNANLAADIQSNLAKVASAEELAQIEVINIDAWVRNYLKKRGYRVQVVGDDKLREMWDDILDSGEGEPGLPKSFYTEEWDRIVLPNRIRERQAYLKVSRKGRGVALSKPQRAKIWDVFDEMQGAMQLKGWRTYQEATHDACDFLSDDEKGLPYRHIIVDETQDMGAEALRLIRHLVPEHKNDLFFVGDGHQRIYRRKAVMGHWGIKIVGRSHKLKINYRTTEEIRRFASAILEGLAIDNLDDGSDTSNDYRSLTSGPEPILKGHDSVEEEIAWIAEQVRSSASEPAAQSSFCVLLRTNKLCDSYAKGLRETGLDVVQLGARADNPSVAGVRVATLHRVKGLEFRHVILAAMNSGQVPNSMGIKGSEDPTELRDHEMVERALVHVAATRAIESLTVTWFDELSDYFCSIENHP